MNRFSLSVRIAAGLIVTIVFCIGDASLATAQTVPPTVSACTAEADNARRLACFDRAIARLSEQQAAASPAPTASSAAAPLSAEDGFGRRGEMVREERERERQSVDTPKLKELTAVVTKISSRAHGELVITLDNGQVWTQIAVDTHFLVKLDDKVTVKPGVLGSFRLVAPAGRATQVKRLR
jgi:hypothetical protein